MIENNPDKPWNWIYISQLMNLQKNNAKTQV